MQADLPTDRTVFQNAWVVTDVEASAHRWASELGVGPFFVTEYTDQLTEVTYRGSPSELSMLVAISQAGPVQIELIEPTTPVASAYRDSVPAGSEGFHHMCVWTHDFDADAAYFESLGYAAATTGYAGGAIRFGYFDTRPLTGCMLEVVQYQQAIKDRFDAIASAAAAWDGRDPVRPSSAL